MAKHNDTIEIGGETFEVEIEFTTARRVVGVQGFVNAGGRGCVDQMSRDELPDELEAWSVTDSDGNKVEGDTARDIAEAFMQRMIDRA